MKPSTSIISTTNSMSNFISKRSRIDEMGSKEQEMQKNNESKPPIDDAPTIKLCLRLPNGSKETISISANNTVSVSYLIKIFIF
jgi:hypothetical protein